MTMTFFKYHSGIVAKIKISNGKKKKNGEWTTPYGKRIPYVSLNAAQKSKISIYIPACICTAHCTYVTSRPNGIEKNGRNSILRTVHAAACNVYTVQAQHIHVARNMKGIYHKILNLNAIHV